MRAVTRIVVLSMVWIFWSGSIYANVDLSLQSPADGSTVVVPPGTVNVQGRAEAIGGSELDVVFVIDISKSTNASTGRDFDGDGRKDTILDAEKFSVLQKIGELEALNQSTSQQTARVGVIGFCGTAIQASGLTGQFNEVNVAMKRLDYDSWTNFQDAVELGLHLFPSGGRPNAKKLLLFMSDGKPNRPGNEQSAREAALAAAETARQQGVIIHSFAIGSEEVTDPVILKGMAARTGGKFTHVKKPADLPEIFDKLSLVNIRQVTIKVKNMTTAQASPSTSVVPEATGLFSQKVKIGLGRHEITATAEAEDGSTGSRSVIVTGVAASAPTPAPTSSPTPVPTPTPACNLEKAETHLRQGLAYAGQKDFRNSELEFLKAIELCETYAEAHANLGVTYMGQNALNKAERSLQRALELAPKDSYVHYNLAAVYSLNGKTDLSLQALDDALENGFSEIDALRHDPDLKNVRQNPEFTKIL